MNSGYVLLRFSLLLTAYQVFLAGNTIPITLILIWILTFPLDSPCLPKITFSSFSCNIYILWIEWMSLFQITFSVIFCFLVFFLMSLYYHRGFYLSILFCIIFSGFMPKKIHCQPSTYWTSYKWKSQQCDDPYSGSVLNCRYFIHRKSSKSNNIYHDQIKGQYFISFKEIPKWERNMICQISFYDQQQNDLYNKYACYKDSGHHIFFMGFSIKNKNGRYNACRPS